MRHDNESPAQPGAGAWARSWAALTSSRQPDPGVEVPRTADEAKTCVFAHWAQLEALCRRRFPGSENLAHEGLLYVLEQLEADEWQRVRGWEGHGRFVTFLTTIAARLLTDFSRMKYGHIRMPEWLAAMSDPMWHAAYRLVVVERLDRVEAVEHLLTAQPCRERAFVEEVVTTVHARCRRRMRYADTETTVDEDSVTPPSTPPPDEDLRVGSQELAHALASCLDTTAAKRAEQDSRVTALVGQLRAHVKLADEERLLLRMRYVEGMKMTEIVKVLKLKGDPYKRYHKILDKLRVAFEQAGLACA